MADFELRSNLKSIKMDEHPKYLNFLQHIPLTKDVAIESYKLFLYIISVHESKARSVSIPASYQLKLCNISACFFLSIALAVVLSYLSMFAACVTYRKNMKNIYRGNHVDIPTFETRLPRMILVS